MSRKCLVYLFPEQCSPLLLCRFAMFSNSLKILFSYRFFPYYCWGSSDFLGGVCRDKDLDFGRFPRHRLFTFLWARTWRIRRTFTARRIFIVTNTYIRVKLLTLLITRIVLLSRTFPSWCSLGSRVWYRRLKSTPSYKSPCIFEFLIRIKIILVLAAVKIAGLVNR